MLAEPRAWAPAYGCWNKPSMGQDWTLCWPKVVWLPLKVFYTQLAAHSTLGGPARPGRLWGEPGDPVQGQTAPGEEFPREVGAGGNVAEKILQSWAVQSTESRELLKRVTFQVHQILRDSVFHFLRRHCADKLVPSGCGVNEFPHSDLEKEFWF